MKKSPHLPVLTSRSLSYIFDVVYTRHSKEVIIVQKPRILITGASGNTGYPTAKELLELGFPVRAFVRNTKSAKARELERLGAEIFVGNMNDIRDVRLCPIWTNCGTNMNS